MAAEGRKMLGAILGDIAGSKLEFANNRKRPEVLFPEDCFTTDDTLMTIAAFKAAFSKDAGGTSLEELFLRETIRAVLLHPDAGWGLRFLSWIRGIVEENGIALSNLHEKSGIRYRPNGSAGNGAAMRVSPIPYLSSSLEECKALTRKITGVTHDHPDSYRAAECVATSIYLALEGKGREGIRKNILSYYPEVEGMTYEVLNSEYRYTELAKDTVPQAMACFLESKDFEDALSMAVSIGGDADTLGAITGGLAEAFYGWTEEEARRMWPWLIPFQGKRPRYVVEEGPLRQFLALAHAKFPGKFPDAPGL